MADIKKTRRRFTVILAILLGIDLFAVGVLVSPIGRASRAGQQQYTQQQLSELWKDLQTRNRELLPGRNIDQKIAETRQQVTEFYANRLPGSYSSIAEQLGRVATANNVKIATSSYKDEETEQPGLQRIQIQTAITGDYAQAVKFINALERDRMFFIIDGVSLAQTQGGMVHLNVQIETYMKSA
jgi:Tfp pilus assembly protein PilO